jgi:hypothetical protein
VDWFRKHYDDNEEWNCSLCDWTDYESDWGGNRWRKMDCKTICPECGRHFSYTSDSDKVTIHPFLKNRAERRIQIGQSLWFRIKKLFSL